MASVGFRRESWSARPGPGAEPQKEAKMSIEQFIANEVKSTTSCVHEGNAAIPAVRFLGQVVQILDHVGVGSEGLNVLNPPNCARWHQGLFELGRPGKLYVKGDSSAAAT